MELVQLFYYGATMIKIKIRFIVMHIYILTWNLSSAFNPSRLAPVEHAHGHTLIKTGAIHWSGGQPITARQGGGLTPLQLSVSNKNKNFTNFWVVRVGIKPPITPVTGEPTLTTELKPPVQNCFVIVNQDCQFGINRYNIPTVLHE